MDIIERPNNFTVRRIAPVLPGTEWSTLEASAQSLELRDWNPADFTLELRCMLSPDFDPNEADTYYAWWETKKGNVLNYRAMFMQPKGRGIAFRLLAGSGRCGRTHPFYYQLYTGDLTAYRGQNLYVTIGLSTERQEGSIIIRNTMGEILDHNCHEFIADDGLAKDFLQPIPLEEQSAALDLCWEEMGNSSLIGAPEIVTLNFEGRGLLVTGYRNSHYRPEVHQIAPTTSADNLITVGHPPAVKNAMRRIGYSHYTSQWLWKEI